MASITPTIAELRSLVKDPNTPSSYNLVRAEVPRAQDGATIGSALVFYLAQRPIVSGSVYITQDALTRQTPAAASVTVDYVNAILTFTTAPTAKVFLADYNFNYFADAEYQTFINEGLRFLGLASTAAVDELLVPACYEAAKAFFYEAMATDYAPRYRSSGGSVGQDVDVVTANYVKLMKASQDRAVTMRDDYYKRQGKRLSSSSHFFNYGISPITPRR